MKFSLFTTRTRKPSLRLRILARCFQGYSMLMGASTVAILIYRQFFLDNTHTPRWAFTPPYAYLALSFMSLYLVGRALLRRQRWGAYLAGVTLGIPIIKQLLSPFSMNADIPQIAFGTIALCTLVTVWDELGGAHDSDFDDDEIEDASLEPVYNEPRLLTTPAPTINKVNASNPLPIKTARDN